MDWGKLKFFLGEVGRNFTRNAGMQATAIGTVTVTIILLGAFLYVRGLLIHLSTEVFNQIEISVYLSESATPPQAAALRTAIARDHRVRSVQFVPKKDGLKELRRRMGGQVDTSLLTQNPLPDKLRVRVRTPEDVSRVAAHVAKMPGVSAVNYGQDVVARLMQLSSVLGKIGIGVIAIFIVIASIIISNTIRLTVFARRREIGIMQLVGATNAYIRLPFICEGFLDGLFGAILALGLLMIARAELLPKLWAALPFVRLGATSVDPWQLALELLLVGGAVGAVASWVSVGRYLRV
ncbi:MAG: ABC transporter permease [Candidatus Eremiobacteraeota bacterium]|nr:ABC transporter permease [Candidatus Eremiobacteraeota bacterium]